MAYFCNVLPRTKQLMLTLMPFEEGKLPVKYLGVPLISSNLLLKDCKELVEKVRNRIGNWVNKSLSFAGRLQLINSVLSSMHVYWASVFILPGRVIAEIEQLLRGFLWCQGDMKRGKAKVAWDTVCLPKYEGGLGIRRMEPFNTALMVSHIWSILTCRESLWVKWIHSYKLKGRSLWAVPLRPGISWGWRKLLQIRDIVRPFIWSTIGNGKLVNVWFDNWCALSPIMNHLTSRRITQAGFTLNDRIADLICDGDWRWPSTWHMLNQIPCPPLHANQNDVYVWRDHNGVPGEFSVSAAWNSLRERCDEVHWTAIVWFPHCIPRHAFHLWLVMRRRLKTQDRLKQWDVGASTDLNLLKCPLCSVQPDSHSHLFFECSFSSQVWMRVRDLAGMHQVSDQWDSIIAYLQPISRTRKARSIIGRLLVAATSYFIWQERNNRVFKKGVRSAQQLRDIIVSTVRLKLVTFKFKKSDQVARLLDGWRLPRSCITHG